MIPADLLNFLKELKDNNHKPWFDENRERYQNLRKEMVRLIQELIPQIAQFDPSILPLEPKDCIFRINRDIRFSNDKTPYKTNMGAYMARGGRKSPYGGYYLHIEPGGSFLAGGIYQPSSAVLKEVRSEIYYDVEKFKSIILDKTFKTYFKEIWSEKLKSAPRGFPSDWPDIELLKFKHYTVIHELQDDKIIQKDFPDFAIKVFKVLQPFNTYFNRVIENI